MPDGTIATINAERGYGFIRRSAGQPNIFFHHRQTPWRDEEFGEQLRELRVTFDERTDQRNGKPEAFNVRAAD